LFTPRMQNEWRDANGLGRLQLGISPDRTGMKVDCT